MITFLCVCLGATPCCTQDQFLALFKCAQGTIFWEPNTSQSYVKQVPYSSMYCLLSSFYFLELAIFHLFIWFTCGCSIMVYVLYCGGCFAPINFVKQNLRNSGTRQELIKLEHKGKRKKINSVDKKNIYQVQRKHSDYIVFYAPGLEGLLFFRHTRRPVKNIWLYNNVQKQFKEARAIAQRQGISLLLG